MSASNIDPKQIEAIPLDVLRVIPAEQPPTGITPNFEHPATRVPTVLGVGYAFLFLALSCYLLRVYTKLFLARKWSWDDWTITFGFAFSIIVWAFVTNGCINGSTGKHQYEVHLDLVLADPSLLQAYFTVVFSQPALALIKGSLFIQYYHIFGSLRWMRRAIWIGGTIHTVFYLAIIITAFALCSPRHGETWIETILSKHYLEFANFSTPVGVIGTVIDFYLLILPLPAIARLQMNAQKRLALAVVFLTGALAAGASTGALVYRIRLQFHPSDTTWKVAILLMWVQLEMYCGVAAASMPAVRQFFKRKEISLTSLALTLRSNLSFLISRSRSDKSSHHTTEGHSRWYGKSSHGSNSKQTSLRKSSSHDGLVETKQPEVEMSRIRVTTDFQVERGQQDGLRADSMV